MDDWKQEQFNALPRHDAQDDLFAGVALLVRGMGFEHCAYAMRTSLLAGPGTLLLSNYPQAWQQRYRDQGYQQIDPVALRGAASLEPFAWVARTSHDTRLNEFWADARRHGIRCGVSLPVMATNGLHGMLTVTHHDESIAQCDVRQRWPMLPWLAQMAHHGLAWQALEQWGAETLDSLSPRELEVLRRVAEGDTNQQIAERFQVTERTINFHLHKAMAKLGASNRTAAAVRAVMLGLVA